MTYYDKSDLIWFFLFGMVFMALIAKIVGIW